MFFFTVDVENFNCPKHIKYNNATTTKFDLKKLELSLYHVVQTRRTHFDILNRLAVAHACEGRTDRLLFDSNSAV